MEPVRPKPRLYKPLGEFGRRRGQQFSVEKLEDEGDTILQAVGTPDQLNDWYKRRRLAMRVEAALRSIVASIIDPVDRRIAQAVLATEPEFFGKGVEERKQHLREKDGISDDRYSTRRPHVVEYLAAKLEDVLAMEAAPQSRGELKPDDNAHHVPTTSSEVGSAVHPAGAHTPTIERAALQTGSRRQSRRRSRVISLFVAAALVLEGVAGAVILTRHHASEPTWNGMNAAQLERRYDGKLAGGQEGAESHCADGDMPPSLVVDGATTPPVMGPEGGPVGNVQLRKSQICPTVVWARVLWKGDEQGRFQIPPGWTLHVVMHRPDTKSSFDETEPSSASQIPYAVSSTSASARGCVYAEAYFTNGDVRTASVPTSCVKV